MNIPNLFNSSTPPRSETFLSFLHHTLCPRLTIGSPTVILIIIQIVYFFVLIGFSPKLGPTFLEPTASTLQMFGALEPYSLKRGELWLVISTLFLHRNFLHLLFDIINLVIAGNLAETLFQNGKSFVFLTLISGTMASFTGALFSDQVGIGGSLIVIVILFGVMGNILGKWHEIDSTGRCGIALIGGFLGFFLIIGSGYFWGGLGAAWFGLWIGLGHSGVGTAKIGIGVGGISVLLVLGIFFGLRNPKPTSLQEIL